MVSRFNLQHKTLIASSICAILVGCGGGGGSNDTGSVTPVNTAPTVNSVSPITLQTQATKEILITATDKENNTLTYSIKTQPKVGKASIDSKTGKVIYTAANVVGDDSFEVSVSDGTLSTAITIAIKTQVETVFDYQFYKVTNPETGNYQVVRYNPNDNNEKTNQKVVKDNVILGNKVFMMSAAKNGDQSIYKKREYAIFLDPNASKETRTQTVNGATTEYVFYTNNILKRFSAENPENENVIFSSAQLGAKLGGEGISALGDTLNLYMNEVDITNSYVELRAYERLPDTLRGELSDTIKNTYITVRLSDGKVTQGRTIKPIVDNLTGQTNAVLVNYSAAHVKGKYPTTASEAARLQTCSIDLSSCTDVQGATGQFYFLAQNDSHIYVAKDGAKTIYAYDKLAKTLTAVTGGEYPATYDAAHHRLKFGGGHGGTGIFSNFFNMTNVVDTLSEGNSAYLLVNYNLDTQDPVLNHPFYGDAYAAKNAVILKLEGNKAVKVYDNGTGQDLANTSDSVPLSYNLNLTAVKNGHIFVEAAKIRTDIQNIDYQQGWLNTATTTAKKTLDNVVIQQDINYFTALRVPAVAVGDYVYVNETNPIPSATRIYNVYKLPLNNPQAKSTDTGITHTTGRMYFERSAFRNTGVYEGNVLLWNKLANAPTNAKAGDIFNATTNTLMGNALDLDAGVTNVTADASGNTTLAGIGGLFGLHMTGSHGAVPLLTSGFSTKQQSLKKVNQIQGSWIID